MAEQPERQLSAEDKAAWDEKFKAVGYVIAADGPANEEIGFTVHSDDPDEPDYHYRYREGESAIELLTRVLEERS